MVGDAPKDVSELLTTLGGGEPPPPEPPESPEPPATPGVDLTRTTYGQLRKIAGCLMAREPPGHTLQATALVNEAYLKLVGGQQVDWKNRRHFVNTVARAMRQVLIDRARRYATAKHGGARRRFDLRSIDAGSAERFPLEHAEQLDEAVSRLEEANPRWGEIVRLRFYTGLTIRQTAEVMGLSPTLIKDDWSFARAWLANELGGADSGG